MPSQSLTLLSLLLCFPVDLSQFFSFVLREQAHAGPKLKDLLSSQERVRIAPIAGPRLTTTIRWRVRALPAVT